MSDTKQKTAPVVGNKTRLVQQQARLSLQKVQASQDQLRTAKAKLKAAKKVVKHAKKAVKKEVKAAAEIQQNLRALLKRSAPKKLKGGNSKKPARRAAAPSKTKTAKP